MTAPAKKRVRYRIATTPMDMRHAVEVLAREHAERMAGPRACPCRCSKPWPDRDSCIKCGRALQARSPME